MMKTRRATAKTGPCARNPPSPLRTFTNAASASGFLRVALQTAVLHAVAEVEHEADRQPHAEPQPVGPAEAVNHRAADDDAENRDERQRRHDEGARNLRPADAHDPDPRADQD